MKQSTVVATVITGTVLIFFIIGMGFLFTMSSGSMSKSFEGAGFSGVSMQDSNSIRTLYDESESLQQEASTKPVDTPRNMYFVDYGTHVFVTPNQGPYSTFALDVDAASYTIAKHYVMTGSLPPTDAIRAEEFVNYFDYDYPNPEKNIQI